MYSYVASYTKLKSQFHNLLSQICFINGKLLNRLYYRISLNMLTNLPLESRFYLAALYYFHPLTYRLNIKHYNYLHYMTIFIYLKIFSFTFSVVNSSIISLQSIF